MGVQKWNAKTFPTGKEEMNILCQMPMGLLNVCVGTWLFFKKRSQNYCVKIRKEVGFLAGELKFAFS